MSLQNRYLLFGYFLFSVGIVIAYRITHIDPILFLPLIAGIAICARFSLLTGLSTLLLYLSVEGALKLMSGNALPLRLGPDLMILTLLFQAIRVERMEIGFKSQKVFNAPFATLFWLHALWILVQFFNPFSIGLDSSLAGYKVYISSLLLYFIAYFSVRDESSTKTLSWTMIAIVFTQIAFSTYQFNIGEQGLMSWSPYYSSALGIQFHGAFFRPFGLSNVPGGATTLIFLLTPICISFLTRSRSVFNIALSILLLVGVSYVLFVSQVRSAQIKCAVGLAIFFVVTALRTPKQLVGFATAIVLAVFALPIFFNINDPTLQTARVRFESLSNAQNVYENRSRGTYENIVRIISEQPFGLGLSRVGAASAPFKDRIQNDPRYGVEWSFADNLYKALLIEVGIPGAILFLAFLAAAFYQAVLWLSELWPYQNVSNYSWMVAATATVFASFLGHFGSEGSLYQPESSLVWLLLGVVLKTGALESSLRRTTRVSQNT